LPNQNFAATARFALVVKILTVLNICKNAFNLITFNQKIYQSFAIADHLAVFLLLTLRTAKSKNGLVSPFA